MPETLRFHDGQAYIEGSNEEPYPVKVMQDVQSRNITVAQDGPPLVAVSTSVITLIVPANPNRRSVLLTNLTGSGLVYLSPTNNVSATLARAVLAASVGSNFTIYGKDAVYGLATVGAQSVLIWEEEFSG